MGIRNQVSPVETTAFRPMILDLPTSSPSAVYSEMPSLISFERISIRLRQPAEPTARYEIRKLRKSALEPVNFEE